MDTASRRPVAVLYATREGQTRHIAERIADVLRKRGAAVVAADVRTSGDRFDLAACAGAVLAASVHMGRYEPEMVRFAQANAATLATLPNAFVAVSMSQATVDRADASDDARTRARDYTRSCTDRFIQESGWQPERVVPVAGALRYSQYNFIVRWVMKGMARRAGASTDTTRDHDYTNWGAVERFAEAFAADMRVASTIRPAAS